ncbi:hypothetical protein A2U01_0018981 [Trifolium medium]|uniref:Transmembrane protein n=1 Tax=Trifolium medium TaxID=97028 RepID=A0A392NE26_9FABA|nr:hypothetical protein [Trifolium medium]
MKLKGKLNFKNGVEFVDLIHYSCVIASATCWWFSPILVALSVLRSFGWVKDRTAPGARVFACRPLWVVFLVDSFVL